MNLTEMVGGCWAIRPDVLDEIKAIYATHLRGDKIDIPTVEAKLGRPLGREEIRYNLLDGGVAVLEMSGIMAPKANLFMQVSGGMSTQQASRQLQAAAADPAVQSIIVAADTPGGSVLGVPEFGDVIRAVADQKPLVFHSDGVLASAGYWVGSAANQIYISGPMVQVGSIGVVVTRNYSPNGSVKEEHVTAGKYKRIATANEPLSKEARALVQADVDYCYSLFVDVVARNRGVSVDAVLEHMADGRVFRGGEASMAAGLVDGVSTLDDLIEAMATNPAKFGKRSKARVSASRISPKSDSAGAVLDGEPPAITIEGNDMEIKDVTRDALQTGNPALFAALEREFMAAGAAAELTRQNGVRATAVPGHEKLVEEMVADGKTTPAEAALKVNAAVRLAHTTAAQQHLEDGAPVIKGSAAPVDVPDARAAQMAKVEAYQKEHPGTSVEAACAALGIQS